MMVMLQLVCKIKCVGNKKCTGSKSLERTAAILNQNNISLFN